MLRRFVGRKAVTRMPFFRVFAIAQVALLARRHLTRLDRAERARLFWLVRRGPAMGPAERTELRALVAKLEPFRFAGSALDSFSPVPLPSRFTSRR